MPDHVTDSPAQVADLRVWYHFPISLLKPVYPQMMTGWTVKKRDRTQTSPSQFTYFHPFIAKALFEDGEDPRFQVLTRDCRPSEWQGEFCKRHDDKTRHSYRRFKLSVEAVDLWIAGPGCKTKPDNPGLGILSVAVRITGVADATLDGGYNPNALDGAAFRPLTLHDAMDALEWIRRVFPRWRVDGMPADSLSQVIDPKGIHLPSHPEPEEDAAYRNEGRLLLFPWVEKLLSPLRVDGKMAIHLGDERAFMSSAIALETPVDAADTEEIRDAKARALLRDLPDGTLFRLAEADRAGSGDYAYDSAFLETLRDRYFYTRHAPDRSAGRAHIGNATLYLMSQHHLCALGAGDFARGSMLRYMERYYRHMQFLCVFEYFRLIQFSQRLTVLVEQHRDNPPKFRAEVLKIRGDFLTHTHLHHFTNVSSQLQAKEMFDKLQAATGIPDLFAEVERELDSAANYAAMLEANEQARRGEELNNLVAIGVPASLALTVAGFDWLTGNDAPDVPFFQICSSAWSAGLVQVSALLTLAFALWAGLRWWLATPADRAKTGVKMPIAMLVITLFLMVFHDFRVGRPPICNPPKTLGTLSGPETGALNEKTPDLQEKGGNPPQFMHPDNGLQRVSLQTLPG
jgi:hypothetical protein